MNIIKAAFVLTLLICLEVKAEANKFWDLHGLTLGSSEQTITNAFPEFSCKDDGKLRRCDGYVKSSDHPGPLYNGATNISIVLLNDKLVNIHILDFPAMFDENYAKLEKEYGLPLDDKKGSIETSDGKTYENRTILWHNGTSTIQYDKYWRNIKVSRLLYMLKD
jgi:hypothetical protein